MRLRAKGSSSFELQSPATCIGIYIYLCAVLIRACKGYCQNA